MMEPERTWTWRRHSQSRLRIFITCSRKKWGLIYGRGTCNRPGTWPSATAFGNRGGTSRLFCWCFLSSTYLGSATRRVKVSNPRCISCALAAKPLLMTTMISGVAVASTILNYHSCDCSGHLQTTNSRVTFTTTVLLLSMFRFANCTTNFQRKILWRTSFLHYRWYETSKHF